MNQRIGIFPYHRKQSTNENTLLTLRRRDFVKHMTQYSKKPFKACSIAYAIAFIYLGLNHSNVELEDQATLKLKQCGIEVYTLDIPLNNNFLVA